MDKITPCLWYDGTAHEAAKFYTSLFPDSRIVSIDRAAADNPSGEKGDVITVQFELGGRSFLALNGGDDFKFTEAISMSIDCDDQAEVDRYWDALLADGGEASACGWLKDRWGMSWQVVPQRLPELLSSADRGAAERAMKAMLGMGKIDVAELERAAAGEQVGTSAR